MKKHIIILVIVLIAGLGLVGYLENRYNNSDIVEQYQEVKEEKTELTLEQRVQILEENLRIVNPQLFFKNATTGETFGLSSVVANNQERINKLEND